MALVWNGERAKLRIANASATGLLRAALFYQSTLTQALSRSYPPASKRGQYPAARTFNLRSSVLYQPTTVAAIAREKRVRIGFARRAFYGITLELRKGRIGLLGHLRRVRRQLQALAATGGKR